MVNVLQHVPPRMFFKYFPGDTLGDTFFVENQVNMLTKTTLFILELI